MARTFNRRPLSVNTPSSSDLKEHFFNHYNWKGMDANKNFLAADQETFEECNNVYMNAEGILRSRPGIKQTDKDGIIKFWNFNDVTVHLVKNNDTYTLLFYKNGEYKDTLTELISESVQLIAKDNKIFIFADTPGKFSYYDIYDGKLADSQDAESFVYIPETEVTEGDQSKLAESSNLLSLNEIKSYLYSSAIGTASELHGKDVKLSIDGLNYEFKSFDNKLSHLVIYEKEFTLPINCNYLVNGSIGGTDVYVACEIINEQLKSIYVKIGENGWIERYSDQIGITLQSTVLNKTNIGISDDGLIFYAIMSDGLYFLSTITDENDEYPFETFELIIDSLSYAVCCVISRNLWTLFGRNSDGKLMAYVRDNRDVISTAKIRYENSYDYGLFDSAYIKFYNGMFIGNLHNIYYYEFTLYKMSDPTPPYYWEMYIDDLSIAPLYNIIQMHENFLLYVSNGKYYLSDYKNNTLDKYLCDVPQQNITTSRFSDDGNLIFLPRGLYKRSSEKYIEYLNVLIDQDAIVHGTGNDLYYSFNTDNVVYSNKVDEPISLNVVSGDGINYGFIEQITKGCWSELDNLYVSNGSNLYISELRKNDDGEFLWYFPKKNIQNFPSKITALRPISSTEMAVFLEDEIWYTSYQENLYYSYKSKLKSGLRDGSDVITSYDGTNLIFPTERGLVALSYQNFVASTDQTLTYLSDAISEQFKEFVKHPVKLLRYQFWILAYSPELTVAYLLDLRNNSWWPMTYHSLPTEFYVVDNEVLLLSKNKLFKLDKSDENYYDYDGVKHQINWNFKSQKLHLNAVNYYKHISNLTLYSVLDTDREMNFVMDINNYRKQTDTTEIQTISYKVDTIRTFVKRVNYPKVNEFQYNMHQDDEREIRLPLSLSGITIKYKISGQVR